MAEPISLTVVIMALDEEDNLPVQVERTRDFLREHTADWQIVIVDDGSTDRTGVIADAYMTQDPEHITALHHGVNRGMGAAIRSGYAAARCRWVTQLPADCQIDPRVFLRFFPHMATSDLVLSTYRQRDDGLGRAVLSRGFQTTVRLMTGQRGDFTGTMMFRRELLDRVGPLRSDSFFVNLELPIRALRLRTPHAVVQIEAQPRLHGHSKVANLRRIRHVLGEIVQMRLRELRGR